MAAGKGTLVTQLRVLIVDGEEDMRALLRNLIELANEGLSVAGEAAEGEEGVRRWRDERPEVVLLDQRMPGLTGLETAELILSEDPTQAIILVTAFVDDEVRAAASQIGVRKVVSKRDTRSLVDCLRGSAGA